MIFAVVFWLQKTPEKEITLYFAGPDAMGLVPEVRSVIIVNDKFSTILEELIAGPKDPELYKTIPEETKVLQVIQKDQTLTVNFSKELRDNHWGGSTGEILTVYSIVNSLTEIPTVENVQFWIEGEQIETLVGHIDLRNPLAKNTSIILTETQAD